MAPMGASRRLTLATQCTPAEGDTVAGGGRTPSSAAWLYNLRQASEASQPPSFTQLRPQQRLLCCVLASSAKLVRETGHLALKSCGVQV